MRRAIFVGETHVPLRPYAAAIFVVCAALLLTSTVALAHGVQSKDAAFVAANSGPQIIPFLYLGAKHMVTGYDHLLFLFGVIFFLYRVVDVAIYVTLFSVGHSLTMLGGVFGDVQANAYLVDAVIGLSVVYKAFDNLGGFQTLIGFQPDTRAAVLGFGLIHGFGLATKLQDLHLSSDGLLPNMIAFNVGVELGQLIALTFMLLVIVWWRTSGTFQRHSVIANVVLMGLGFALTQYQLVGYLIEKGF
jgi:hypothetical protein